MAQSTGSRRHQSQDDGLLTKMKRQYASAFAVGIGFAAGLRPMMAPAVLAFAIERGWIRPGHSPFATIVSASASKRIAEFVVSELIADKLPFTPSQLKAAPSALRVVSGTICGAAVHGTMRRHPLQGAVLGGLGALTGAITGYHVRQKFNRNMPDFTVGLLEDGLAVGGSTLIVALMATVK